MRMAVHLPVKFGADIFIQSGVIDISLKFKMAAAAILIFRLYEFGHSSVLIVWYLFMFCANFFSNICYICYSHCAEMTT